MSASALVRQPFGHLVSFSKDATLQEIRQHGITHDGRIRKVSTASSLKPYSPTCCRHQSEFHLQRRMYPRPLPSLKGDQPKSEQLLTHSSKNFNDVIYHFDIRLKSKRHRVKELSTRIFLLQHYKDRINGILERASHDSKQVRSAKAMVNRFIDDSQACMQELERTHKEVHEIETALRTFKAGNPLPTVRSDDSGSASVLSSGWTKPGSSRSSG